MKHRLAARLAALAVLASLTSFSFGQAAPGKITINAAQPGAKISPTLFGLMTEEINYSYEGGIYGELLPNRSFTGTGGNGGAGRGRGRGAPPADGAAPATPPAPSPAPHWFVHTPTGSQATAALETEDPPIKGALARALRLDIATASADAPAGIANDGFWGIPVRPDTTYTASLYARAANGFTGPLTAAIVGNDGKVYASAKVDITDKWELKKFTLKTAAGITPTADAKYIISGASKGSFSITQVSLFPPVFNPRNGAALGERPTTGFRPDILQLLNDMHPAFLRFPGGNYVEGPNIPNRYNFKTTIGSWEDRPGHDGSWGYRSSDGMGFLEFLEWCEDLHMEPLLAVWDGLNLNGGRTVVTGDALKPYIQDALDEIEYVSGDKSTEWGAKRARDGHPEPFALHYVEVGNEDNLNGGTQTYQGPEGRFALFYAAIKAKYPNLQVIATTNPRTTHDIIDNHDYMSPVGAINNAHKYDRVSRTGPKQMEGEWASQEGGLNNGQRPITPTFQCAIADAAFLTGLQRNADIVILSCYAPLFTRTNPGGNNWHTNLIGYDTLTSYGSPSYYTQKMFNNARGDVVLPVAAVTPQQPGANAAAAGFSMDAPFFVGAPAAPAGGPGAGAPGAAGGPGGPGRGRGPGAGGFGGGGGGRGRGRGAPQTPNTAEPLFACASSEDKTGDIIVKVVNVFPNDQLMQVDLSGAKVLPNGTGEVMAAQPDETNTITDPLHVVPKPFAITDASTQWTHTFPGNSITVLRFKTR